MPSSRCYTHAASWQTESHHHYLQGLNLAAIGAETDRRGFVPVGEQMHVLDKSGKPVPNVYCIGDAKGEGTLAVSQIFTIVTCRLDCLQLTMMLVLLRPPQRCL